MGQSTLGHGRSSVDWERTQRCVTRPVIGLSARNKDIVRKIDRWGKGRRGEGGKAGGGER